MLVRYIPFYSLDIRTKIYVIYGYLSLEGFIPVCFTTSIVSNSSFMDGQIFRGILQQTLIGLHSH
jgi:hypothetical protein